MNYVFWLPVLVTVPATILSVLQVIEWIEQRRKKH